MSHISRIAFAAAGMALALQAVPASAIEFVHGSWPPAGEYINRVTLPKAFEYIAKETKGAVTWKLVPGGQLADGRATFQAVGDGLMTAGLGIATYAPNVIPSLTAIYATNVFGNDVVAATGAALETITLHCPSCIAEAKKHNLVLLTGWTSSPYQLTCREPVRSLADLKGKRVRATGGSTELIRVLGGVPVSATLPEAANLLQRGGLDCQFGVHTWLKIFGYADFAKYQTEYPLGLTGPAIGMLMNRDAWNKLTPEQKTIHLRASARISADLAIGQFILENEAIRNELKKTKGLQVLEVTNPAEWEAAIKKFDEAQRAKNVADAKKFGVADPGKIIDTYAQLRQKWAKLSPGIGHDIDKFTNAIWTEIYSKVDPAKL